MAAAETSAEKPRRYASELLGRALVDGWHVVEQLEHGPEATGGRFSQGYIVKGPTGTRAFLKALDFSEAFESGDPTHALEAMTAAFNHERDLLRRCRMRRMDRVVLAIADGSVTVDPTNAYSVVPYIIFELADGDVRKYVSLTKQFDLRWALRTLHQVATGLQQLHGERIAHQDLKPSNVMVFRRGSDAKLGDLGRASDQAKVSQHDDLEIPGDRAYAPPELCYSAAPNDWAARRFGNDAYQLGSMIAFLFTGLSMTVLWIKELQPDHWPGRWSSTFAEVLPYVRAAFDRAIQQVENQLPPDVRRPLTTMLRRLCDPDPALRGHPRNRAMRHGDPFSLERFVSELNLLARKAESAVIMVTE